MDDIWWIVLCVLALIVGLAAGFGAGRFARVSVPRARWASITGEVEQLRSDNAALRATETRLEGELETARLFARVRGAEPEPAPEPEPAVDAAPEPEVDAAPEPEPEPEPEAAPEPAAAPEPEPAAAPEPEPEPEAAPAAAPAPAGAGEEDELPPFDPPPAEGEPDDLTRISGVGPQLQELLHGHGISTFAQIAALDDANLDALQARLPEFPGRIRRDDWVGQATALAAGD